MALGHAVLGLVTGDMTFDGGYAVIEGGRHVHLTSAGGLAAGAAAFGASGTGLLLIAYDPSLVARRKWVFVVLGVAVIAGVMLISRGVRCVRPNGWRLHRINKGGVACEGGCSVVPCPSWWWSGSQ